MSKNAYKMLEMRIKGATLQEIADTFGVTRHSVFLTLNSSKDVLGVMMKRSDKE
jgi:DNA-binding CsgD family transcriptional regulator